MNFDADSWKLVAQAYFAVYALLFLVVPYTAFSICWSVEFSEGQSWGFRMAGAGMLSLALAPQLNVATSPFLKLALTYNAIVWVLIAAAFRLESIVFVPLCGIVGLHTIATALNAYIVYTTKSTREHEVSSAVKARVGQL